MRRILTVLIVLIPAWMVAAPPRLPSESHYRQTHGIRDLPHFSEAGGAAVTADGFEIVLQPGAYVGTATVVLTVSDSGAVSVRVDSSKPIFLGPKTDTPPVTPDPPDGLEAAIRAIQAPANSGDRQAIAKLYRDTAPLTTSTNQLKAVTNALWNAVVDSTSDPAGWTTWKTEVDSAITTHASTHAEYVAAWGVIAGVLD